MAQTILGIDIGLKGGISNGEIHLPMPTYKKCVKEAVYVFKRDSKGKKEIYKSGLLKGQFKKVIKTPAKYKTEIDTVALLDYFKSVDVVAIEDQGTTAGNSARANRTTSINYGKVLACAELSGAKIVIIQPQTWKKALGLSKDKQESLDLAKKLYNETFKLSQDGLAEALLIWHYYKENLHD